MRRQILALCITLFASGCGSHGGAEAGDAVECRLPGNPAFQKVCTLEKANSPEGRILILRRPDGGFHRLLVVKDGRGVIAADGAEPVQVSQGEGNSIEIDVGTGAYRLPAKIKP